MHPPERPYSDQETLEGIERLERLGATHTSIYTMDRGFTRVEEHIEYLAALKARRTQRMGAVGAPTVPVTLSSMPVATPPM
jgi:hypothetical protein